MLVARGHLVVEDDDVRRRRGLQSLLEPKVIELVIGAAALRPDGPPRPPSHLRRQPRELLVRHVVLRPDWPLLFGRRLPCVNRGVAFSRGIMAVDARW
jgi:hypothetical protein